MILHVMMNATSWHVSVAAEFIPDVATSDHYHSAFALCLQLQAHCVKLCLQLQALYCISLFLFLDT